nr:unnamed protein product [Callosobruchus analis]
MGVEKKTTENIESKQLTWYGHLMRIENEGLAKTTFQWIPNKRRKIGRLRKSRKEQIQKAMQTRGLKNNE